MLLYPRLPQTLARKMAEEASSRSIEYLFNVSSVSHPAAIYAPTGGNRVNPAHLRAIDQCIREAAQRSGYPYAPDDLSTRRFDADSGRILHEMMEIAPADASHQGTWAFMACVLWPDVVRWRFPGGAEGSSKERFLGAGRGIRNTFGRVWWRAYILKQPESSDPYKFLNALGEDELVQITERPGLAGSPTLAKQVCQTFLEMTNRSAGIPRSRLLRDAMKRLRRLLPIINFDALDQPALKALIDEIFLASLHSLQS